MNFKKKAISITLATLMLANTTTSFAASFKDMKNAKGQDHWSLPFVTEMSGKGFIGGYADGTFRPNKSVTRVESIVFVSRFFPASEVKATYEANKAKWNDLLNANLIPDFARPAIVFGLENKWYTQAYIKELMDVKTRTQKEAKRYEFSVYLVRALGWDKEMSNAAVVSYKDASTIPKQAVPYIEILGKKGVIDKTGNFNPQKSITRGEVAKMMSVSYGISGKNIQNQTTPTVQPNQNVVMPSGTVVEGQVSRVTLDSFNIILSITDRLGNTNSFTNRTSGIIVSRGGKLALPQNISEGQSVKLYTDGTTLKGVEIVAERPETALVTKNLSGEIAELNINANTIKIRNGKDLEEYKFAKNIEITKDGRVGQLYNLLVGDSADVVIRNSEITSINAKTVRRTLKNVVIKAITSYANGTATVTIVDEKGVTYQMEYTVDSIAYQNNKIISLSALSVGYEADVYANSNQIIDITIFGRTQGTLLTGVVTHIDLRNDTIYVETKDKKEVRVIFDRNVEVINQVNNKKMSIYDLEKGQNLIVNGYEGNNIFEATRIAYY